MKKIIYILAVILGLMLVSSFYVVRAQQKPNAVRVTTLNAPVGEEKDFYTVWGEVVEINGEVNGDVMVAGGEVYIKGDVNGDVLAAGGTVSIEGKVTQNVRVIGGEVKISGEVGRNVSVLAGDLILEDGLVLGGLAAGAGSVKLDSVIQGETKILAGDVSIAGNLGDNLTVNAGTISVEDSAVVDGNFTYTSDSDAVFDKNASISGQIARSTVPQFAPVSQNIKEDANMFLANLRIYSHMVSFLAALLVGALMVRFFPNFLKGVSDHLGTGFIKNSLYGFALFFLIPFLMIFIAITLIGLPLAFILFVFYMLAIYTSKIFLSFWFGEKIVKENGGFYKKLILGLLVFYVLRVIPVVGFFVGAVALFAGLGALFTYYPQYHKRGAKLKIF